LPSILPIKFFKKCLFWKDQFGSSVDHNVANKPYGTYTYYNCQIFPNQSVNKLTDYEISAEFEMGKCIRTSRRHLKADN